MNTGFIYCLYNPFFKSYGENVYKLGKTNNLNTRLSGYTTGYIDKSEYILTSAKLSDKNLAEKLLFTELKKYRIKDNREFFKCDIKIIKDTFEKVELLYKLKNDTNSIINKPNETIIINNYNNDIVSYLNDNKLKAINKDEILDDIHNDRLVDSLLPKNNNIITKIPIKIINSDGIFQLYDLDDKQYNMILNYSIISDINIDIISPMNYSFINNENFAYGGTNITLLSNFSYDANY
jgi:hypothetical protein